MKYCHFNILIRENRRMKTMMKKKVYAVILAATLAITSVTPMYAAEFSSGMETDEFSVGNVESDDSEEVAEIQDGTSEVDAESDFVSVPAETTTQEDSNVYQDDEIRLEIVKNPDKTEYLWGQIDSVYDMKLTGLTLRVTYEDEEPQDITFKEDDEYAEDSHWNTYEYKIKYQGTEQSEYGYLKVGRYVITITDDEKRTVSTSVYVKLPDNIPILNQLDDGKYMVKAPVSGEKAYAKLIPNTTSEYYIGSDDGSVGLYDSDLNEIQLDYEERRITLQQGKEYYLIAQYFDGNPTEVNLRVERVNKVSSVEVVEQPYANTFYTTWISDDSWATYRWISNEAWKKGKCSLEDKFGGKVKVTYENGDSEILSFSEKNKYGYYLIQYITNSGTGHPKPGVYDLHLCYDDSGVETVIKNGATIKKSSEMPTVKENGKVDVPIYYGRGMDGSMTFRLMTGKATRYIITSSPFTIMSASIETGDEKTAWWGLLTEGKPVALAANSVYYITTQQNGQNVDIGTTGTFSVKSESVKISNCTISLQKSYTYTGKAIVPAVEVTEGNSRLRQGINYTISYQNNVNVGTATVTIKGKGSYTGSVKKTFKIQLGVPKLKSAKKSGASAVKLSFAKSTGAAGYEIYRATGSSWKKLATVNATSYTDSNLKKGTTYKYKIRAYSTVNGKKVYSSYSTIKTVKR